MVWAPPLGREDLPAPGVRPNTDWVHGFARIGLRQARFVRRRAATYRRVRVHCFWVYFGTKTRISRRQSRIGGTKRSRCVRPTWAVRLCGRQPDRRARFFDRLPGGGFGWKKLPLERRPRHAPQQHYQTTFLGSFPPDYRPHRRHPRPHEPTTHAWRAGGYAPPANHNGQRQRRALRAATGCGATQRHRTVPRHKEVRCVGPSRVVKTRVWAATLSISPVRTRPRGCVAMYAFEGPAPCAVNGAPHVSVDGSKIRRGQSSRAAAVRLRGCSAGGLRRDGGDGLALARDSAEHRGAPRASSLTAPPPREEGPFGTFLPRSTTGFARSRRAHRAAPAPPAAPPGIGPVVRPRVLSSYCHVSGRVCCCRAVLSSKLGSST